MASRWRLLWLLKLRGQELCRPPLPQPLALDTLQFERSFIYGGVHSLTKQWLGQIVICCGESFLIKIRRTYFVIAKNRQSWRQTIRSQGWSCSTTLECMGGMGNHSQCMHIVFSKIININTNIVQYNYTNGDGRVPIRDISIRQMPVLIQCTHDSGRYIHRY